MMKPDSNAAGLLLSGIDGGNPLGFLAAIGCLQIARVPFPDLRIAWTNSTGVWCPRLSGCACEREDFLRAFHRAFHASSNDAYTANARLPYEANEFADRLRQWCSRCRIGDRRTIDLLAGFGTELYPNNKGIFQDTQFRMVRSADADGQGLPAYALKTRAASDEAKLAAALFGPWTYQDVFYQQPDSKTGKLKKRPLPSFRWDPLDDRRYALRWKNPTKKSTDDLGTVVAANGLAVEALAMLPVFVVGRYARTTAFHRNAERRNNFSWPIWNRPVGVDTVRSLLSLKELTDAHIRADWLAAMGICEVYRCQRIAQNQYYCNFTTAESVM